MEFLNKFDSYQENHESLLTVYVYQKSINELLSIFIKELDKAKNISNSVKRKKICNAYYLLINKYNEMDDSNIISYLYFINEEKILLEHELTSYEKNIIKEYKLREVYYIFDQIFQVEYIQHLFYNHDFIFTFTLNKNHIIISKINKTKLKELEQIKILNENDLIEKIKEIKLKYNYNGLIIIHGISSLLLKIEKKDMYIVLNELLSKDDLILYYETYLMKENLELLEKKLNDLQNTNTNIDLYVFGRLKLEIKDSIESYLLKELYIEERKIKLLNNCIEDKSCFNFKIIPIRSLKSGDIGEQFIEQYKGLMGIKYY